VGATERRLQSRNESVLKVLQLRKQKRRTIPSPKIEEKEKKKEKVPADGHFQRKSNEGIEKKKKKEKKKKSWGRREMKRSKVTGRETVADSLCHICPFSLRKMFLKCTEGLFSKAS